MIVNCKAQSPVYTLGNNDIPGIIPNNAYIKDVNNILNKFEGTWKYSENGKIFTISLQKIKIDLQGYFKDLLRGNYKYVSNNLTLADTTNYPLSDANLSGARLWEGDSNKITLFFYDPERPKMSTRVTLTYSNINGVEKLHWDLKLTGYVSSRNPNMNQAIDFRVPTNVELIKQ
ncbi:DUF6705 family protein [Chryseobacterium sp. FDAARGOS 1104]|nr:DUF6705 family protein [Chryseobacterium sp. FDAARGOS 1104]QQV03649.1 hypothetical protein I6I61_04745 [Chryseobacterium sp. FDAARGOS 1104]